MAEQAVDARVTMYGWPDNDPPGAGIAYPNLHQKAGGIGTFEDPITFASDARDLAPGTKIYVPYLQKYFIMEDYCADAVASSTDPLHVDLWAGGSPSVDVAKLLAVENGNTRDSAQIIIDAEAGHPVDLTPFDSFGSAASVPTASTVNNAVSPPVTAAAPPAADSSHAGTQSSDASGIHASGSASPISDHWHHSWGHGHGGSFAFNAPQAGSTTSALTQTTEAADPPNTATNFHAGNQGFHHGGCGDHVDAGHVDFSVNVIGHHLTGHADFHI
ncbi:hypothetical protein [Methylobacterium planeticum]|uniref:Uncharacterized protein n=1 Tax=Methylobacterium planeticum TaxID=2615211 RepID=A0A6N6MSH9_9HYPH|nr:hypothetical protein [Methylobacterium planeticum]KAB1073231.1 hypothetical protein F6X51_12885 [Methylobacterium planeticum]